MTTASKALATSDPHPKSHPFVALDVLRALAALLVVIAHARGTAFPTFGSLPPDQQGLVMKAFYAGTRLGMEAVLVFFVLSGYLVGGQILRRLQEGRFDLRSYAIDRVTRIMLPLVPAIFLTVAAGAIFASYSPDLVQIAAHIVGLNEVAVPTLTHNGPLWTLAYEIWFYVIGGAIAAGFAYRRMGALAILLVGAAIFFILDARLLLIWMLGAFMVLFREVRFAGWFAVVGFLLFVAGVVFYQLEQDSVSVEIVSLIPPGLSRLMIGGGIALALPFLTAPRTNASLRPLHRPFLFLSAMSYSLYLFHRPLMVILTGLFAPEFSIEMTPPGALSTTNILVFLGLLAGSFAGAFILYMMFERHTDRLRQRLRRRFGRIPAAEASLARS